MFRVTPSQKRVLKLIAQGKDPKEIAQILGVVIRTVEFHINCMLRNNQCHNRIQLLNKAGVINMEFFENV